MGRYSDIYHDNEHRSGDDIPPPNIVASLPYDHTGAAVLTTEQAIALAEYWRHDPTGETTPAERSPLGAALDSELALSDLSGMSETALGSFAAWVRRWGPVVEALCRYEDFLFAQDSMSESEFESIFTAAEDGLWGALEEARGDASPGASARKAREVGHG